MSPISIHLPSSGAPSRMPYVTKHVAASDATIDLLDAILLRTLTTAEETSKKGEYLC